MDTIIKENEYTFRADNPVKLVFASNYLDKLIREEDDVKLVISPSEKG